MMKKDTQAIGIQSVEKRRLLRKMMKFINDLGILFLTWTLNVPQ